MKEFLNSIIDFFTNQGLYILLGIFVLIVGLMIIKGLKKIAINIFKKRKRDGSQVSFIISILDFLLKVILLVISLSIMNVDSTSIIAVISTCGLAIGLALKDSLSNLASGIIIVYNKPFKEGDFVDVNGNLGKVVGINLFTTILCTIDNKKIVLPNSTVLNNALVNYDSRPTRRVDFIFCVSYGTDIKKAEQIILDEVKKNKKVLRTPAPSCRLDKQNDSSLDLILKVWTANVDYWDVYYDLNEDVYMALCNNNVDIPFNQLDVHLVRNDESINTTDTQNEKLLTSHKKATSKKKSSRKRNKEGAKK